MSARRVTARSVRPTVERLVREEVPHAHPRWVSAVTTLICLDFADAHDLEDEGGPQVPPTTPVEVWVRAYVSNVLNLSCDLA